VSFVIKLFIVELSHVGTVERHRVVIGVGIFLLVIGYFSPVPQASHGGFEMRACILPPRCRPIGTAAFCAESPSVRLRDRHSRRREEALYRSSAARLPRRAPAGSGRPARVQRCGRSRASRVPSARHHRSAKARSGRAALLPLYGEDAKQLDGLSLRVERRPSGTIISSTSERRAAQRSSRLSCRCHALRDPVRALELEVKSGAGTRRT